MKYLLTSIMLCALLPAQTPAPKAAPAKTATPAAPAKAATAAKGTAPATAAKAAPKGPNLLDPSTLRARAPEEFDAKLDTTKGAIVIHVVRAWAPNGADRFYNLVRAGFYNGAPFFRVVPGFMVQFGISANPAVSRVWANNNMPDDPVRQSNQPGFVTYAQTSLPNSRSTQLFINYGDNKFLDNQRFAPFGQVIEGMEVARAINAEYGEQPDQGRLTAEGKAYVDRSYPRLDRIVTATIVPAAPAAAAPAAAAAKPAAPAAAAAPKAAEAKK
jgi:peptidyl-prolyl cis-trans isomerase A (cyclophilin A)